MAWAEFRSGKQKRVDIENFAHCLEDNIFSLQGELSSGCYKHRPYDQFRITDPKPRVISKASVRDRLLHHAIYRILYPYFDRKFIFDSYSCRNNKGTHKAFNRLEHICRKISKNYTITCWALKCDIKKFFDSVDHEILIGLLRDQIADEQLLGLIENIIRSFSSNPLPKGEGTQKGVPLGNITSQLFANIYLDPLDKFVKHQLKVLHYLRYADDFMILGDNTDELFGYFIEINQFLKNILKLRIHPDKIYLRKLDWGIDFVGYVARPYYSVPRKRTIERMKRDLAKMHGMSSDKINVTLQSYLGYLKHINGYQESIVLADIAADIM